MTSILGIDAAWTAGQPSGVALVCLQRDGWRPICVAPSYQAFIDASAGVPVDWQARKYSGSDPDIPALLRAAEKLGVNQIDLIALDIPLAYSEVSSRRSADAAISKAFGGKGCATHSPGASRPGPISSALHDQLRRRGYELQTDGLRADSPKRAIEVYPHPALLTLLGRNYRVPYKVAKSGKYWKGQSVRQRVANLVNEFSGIYDRLTDEFGPLPIDLPNLDDVPTLSYLKRYEDALDALVCAWVGQQHLLGRTLAYGDHDAAIWVP